MRFCYRIALALLLVYLFEDTVRGAPALKGRYMWLNCKPDGLNPNCVQKRSQQIDLLGANQRLPASATKDIVAEDIVEDTPETETEEQSGESSGDLDPFDTISETGKDWMDDSPPQEDPQVKEQLLEAEQQEASGEVDYSNYVMVPERVEPKLSPKDLENENMIQ